jgi:hypothetical protein
MGPVKWLAHPFFHIKEHLPQDDPRRSGAFDLTPQALLLLSKPISLPTVEPDEAELAILKDRYPGADSLSPPWSDIKADLQVAGVPLATIHNVTSRELVRMLGRIQSNSPGEPDYGANLERDVWLYEQWQTSRLTWNAIRAEFKRVRAERGWQAVDLHGIRSAVERYAKFFGLPLRKGRAGRPKTAK